MSSEEGLVRAFRELGKIEESARDVYVELLEKLTIGELTTFTSKLIKTEEYHMVLVEEAIDLILQDKASP